MKKPQANPKKSTTVQPPTICCDHCGRPMSAAGCANVHCPGISWRTIHTKGVNTVELRPLIQRSPSKSGFIGALYTKEVRLVDGCECQGVSASTVAFAPDKKQVMQQIAVAAVERAHQYASRGYKVTVKKLIAA